MSPTITKTQIKVPPESEIWPKWISPTLIEFQQLSISPLFHILDRGDTFGPTWEEVLENDWAMPECTQEKTERSQFVARGFDIISSLQKLDVCRKMLIEVRRRRFTTPIFPPYDKVEIILISIDAIIYTLQQRIEKILRRATIEQQN